MTYYFHHAHIKAEDPRRSAAWWADMFGVEVLPEVEFGGMSFIPMRLGGVQITLTRPAPDEPTGAPASIPHFGLEHLGILTEDLAHDLDRIRSQGLRVYEHRPGLGHEIAFVEGPDGVCIELLQAGE